MRHKNTIYECISFNSVIQSLLQLLCASPPPPPPHTSGRKSQGECPGNQPSCFPCIDQEDLGAEGGRFRLVLPHSITYCIHLIQLLQRAQAMFNKHGAILFQLKFLSPSPSPFPHSSSGFSTIHLVPDQCISY